MSLRRSLRGFRDHQSAEVDTDIHSPAGTGQGQRNLTFRENGGLGRFDSAGMDFRSHVWPENLIDMNDFRERAVAVANIHFAECETSPGDLDFTMAVSPLVQVTRPPPSAVL
jgi:hypothetical protein